MGGALNGAPRQLRSTLDTLVDTPPAQGLPYRAEDDEPTKMDGTKHVAGVVEDDTLDRVICEQQRKLVEIGVQRLAGLRAAADAWAAEARLALGDNPSAGGLPGVGPVSRREVLEDLLGRDVVCVVQVRDAGGGKGTARWSCFFLGAAPGSTSCRGSMPMPCVLAGHSCSGRGPTPWPVVFCIRLAGLGSLPLRYVRRRAGGGGGGCWLVQPSLPFYFLLGCVCAVRG